MSRSRGSGLDMALAALAIIMIPIAVFAAFTVKWWLAFIPLGIIIACPGIERLAGCRSKGWRLRRPMSGSSEAGISSRR